MHRGYIKSWRKKIDSHVWKMPPIYMRVYDWIIHSVNHETKTIPTPKGAITVCPGQRITSFRQIAEGVAYYEYGVEKVPNVKTIKTVLEWLEGNGKITVESNAKGTVITLINWDTYNQDQQEKVTQKEQQEVTLTEQTPDTNKNEKNEKNKQEGVNKRFVPPSIEAVAAYMQEIGFAGDAAHFVDYYESKGWFVGKNAMKNWKAAVRTWRNNDNKNSEPVIKHKYGNPIFDGGI